MLPHRTVSDWVKDLSLLPHPEGGYYRETYRSQERIPVRALPERFGGDRVYSTAIYFLLAQGNFSAFHRIQSDERWHFYTGDPLVVHVLHPGGRYEPIVLGNDPAAGHVFQAVVTAGCWFASETVQGGAFSLVGCTVAPGFDFADFELARGSQLANEVPEYASLIKRLCRD